MQVSDKQIKKLITYSLEGSGRIVVPVVFVVLVVVLHLFLDHVKESIWFIMHPLWPLSVAKLSTIRWYDLVLIGGILIVYKTLIEYFRDGAKYVVVVWGLLVSLIVGTNLLQGYQWGMIHPLTGYNHRDVRYWQDQAMIEDPVNFISNYVTLQPTLGYHSRVHPPGPILLLWGFNQLLDEPIVIVSALFIISSSIIWLIYRWVKREKNHQQAIYTVILFGLLPATQIYLWFSIDGMIALLFILTLYFYINWDIKWSIWGVIGGLILSAMMTFAVVWLLAVMTAVAVFDEKYRKRLVKAFFGLGIYTNNIKLNRCKHRGIKPENRLILFFKYYRLKTVGCKLFVS